MISFMELCRESRPEIEAALLRETGTPDTEYIAEIVDSFLELTGEEFDTGVGICAFCGCILVRICDMGRYGFVYPIPVCEDADVRSAIDAVRAYAVKEELPLTFTDVPSEELGVLASAFRHLTLDASDPSGELYRAEIASECMLASEAPCVRDRELSLTDIEEGDVASMARLYTSDEVNEYWGYDFREDTDCVTESYFYDTARYERAMGTAMTLAARVEGEYIGEAVLHAFDLTGGCEIAVRLLPEWQGVGFGKRLLALAFDAAREIGLVRVYGSVMRENERSVAMLSKYMKRVEECHPADAYTLGTTDNSSKQTLGDEILRFVKELYKNPKL